MALVRVWVYSGGGEAEYRGLILFLKRNFPHLDFNRQLPARPGKRPKSEFRKRPGSIPIDREPGKRSKFGLTGTSLIEEMKKRLNRSGEQGDSCDVIFTMDDLDCREAERETVVVSEAIESISTLRNKPAVIVAFAAPELESWLIADWSHCFGSHRAFREKSHDVKKHLHKAFPSLFAAPESFSEWDEARQTCRHKLSDELINAWALYAEFKKSTHTPELLLTCRVKRIAAKCPIFRKWGTALAEWDRSAAD